MTTRARWTHAVLLAAVAAAAPACVTTTEPKADSTSTSAVRVVADEPEGKSGMARAGRIAATVPVNVAWIPWKIVGGGLKGGSDGVQAGFEKGGMPLVPVIFTPVNLAFGLLTGFVEGAAMSPALVGPDDNFGRAFASPTSRQTTIWWYD